MGKQKKKKKEKEKEENMIMTGRSIWGAMINGLEFAQCQILKYEVEQYDEEECSINQHCVNKETHGLIVNPM